MYCEENNILLVHGAPGHPRSQGALEAFNKSIIQRIKYIKFENEENFDINIALDNAVDIYNHTTHSTIKIAL